MNAVIYARYSCDNQREESIEGQIRECTEFAEKKGFTVVRTYIDRAMSAKTDNRPEFRRMIEDSAKREFERVIVWRFDRFSRNRFDSANYKRILRKNGAEVISATEVIPDGAEGILLEALLEGFAEYYSAELSEKVKRGMTENALKCQYNGGAGTIGYNIDENRNYVIDELVAPFVKNAFMMYSEGCTIAEIVQYLNDNGILSAQGKPMARTSATAMLSNCKYKGVYRYADVEIPDGVPRIVSDELFEIVQERLRKNKVSKARFKAAEEYFLSGKLICGECGGLMLGECGKGHNGTRYSYYRCINAKKNKTCHTKGLRKEETEEEIISAVAEQVFTDEMINHLADKVMAIKPDKPTSKLIFENQLSEVNLQIENLVNVVQMGIVSDTTKARLAELEQRRSELEKRIKECSEDGFMPARDQVVEYIRRLREYGNMNDELKRVLVDVFVDSVTVDGDIVNIKMNAMNDTFDL